jgi:hypothetical protein
MAAEERPRRRGQETERDARTRGTAAEARILNQAQWVELQLQRARDRGDFDDLPGYGKPLDLGEPGDRDWWVKKLVEREQLSVLPPALQVRKDDAELDGRLDRLGSEREVRKVVEEFNAAVRAARIQPLGGPPMVTPERDVDAEVASWAERRDARREAARQRAEERARDERAERAARHRRILGRLPGRRPR